jgi:hypothetical protein
MEIGELWNWTGDQSVKQESRAGEKWRAGFSFFGIARKEEVGCSSSRDLIHRRERVGPAVRGRWTTGVGALRSVHLNAHAVVPFYGSLFGNMLVFCVFYLYLYLPIQMMKIFLFNYYKKLNKFL